MDRRHSDASLTRVEKRGVGSTAGDVHGVKPYFIGVGGGTASGKTSLCKVIVSQIDARSVVLLSLDSFYKPLNQMSPGEDGKLNFDVPQAFDLPLILQTMESLVLKRQRCRIPVYDFVTSSRVGDEEVEPADVVILEGILALFWVELRALMSLKLFIDTASDTRLARRILRDTRERGRTLENVLVQYETLVKPAFDNFILPTKDYADLIVPNGATNNAAVLVIVEHVRGKVSQAQEVQHQREAEIAASLAKSRAEDDPMDALLQETTQ